MHMIGTKINAFQFKLENRFVALEELNVIDTLNKDMTETIKQIKCDKHRQTEKETEKT